MSSQILLRVQHELGNVVRAYEDILLRHVFRHARTCDILQSKLCYSKLQRQNVRNGYIFASPFQVLFQLHPCDVQ